MKLRARFFWLILSVALAYILIPKFWKVHELNQQKSELEQEIRHLSTHNQLLENELRLLKEDPVYIEHMARRKFRQAKEGEVIYKLVPPEELEHPS